MTPSFALFPATVRTDHDAHVHISIILYSPCLFRSSSDPYPIGGYSSSHWIDDSRLVEYQWAEEPAQYLSRTR